MGQFSWSWTHGTQQIARIDVGLSGRALTRARALTRRGGSVACGSVGLGRTDGTHPITRTDVGLSDHALRHCIRCFMVLQLHLGHSPTSKVRVVPLYVDVCVGACVGGVVVVCG